MLLRSGRGSTGFADGPPLLVGDAEPVGGEEGDGARFGVLVAVVLGKAPGASGAVYRTARVTRTMSAIKSATTPEAGASEAERGRRLIGTTA
jgi:hypothetical protein